jgi:hypothetical protein
LSASGLTDSQRLSFRRACRFIQQSAFHLLPRGENLDPFVPMAGDDLPKCALSGRAEGDGESQAR